MLLGVYFNQYNTATLPGSVALGVLVRGCPLPLLCAGGPGGRGGAMAAHLPPHPCTLPCLPGRRLSFAYSWQASPGASQPQAALPQLRMDAWSGMAAVSALGSRPFSGAATFLSCHRARSATLRPCPLPLPNPPAALPHP